MYGILENEMVVHAPINYTTPSGQVIVNFNKSEALMINYGFKEVIDTPPTYDNLTEYLIISGYTENKNSITVNYTINKLDSIGKEPTIDEKFKKLNSTDLDHELAIAELYELMLGGAK